MTPLLPPVVAAQGRWVRSRTERLPPATGPTTGSIPVPGRHPGPDGPTGARGRAGPPLRVGVLGESTAAGCGVATHDAGFAGCLARRADALDAVSRRVCAGHPAVAWVGAADLLPATPDFFARDGFHPSSAGHRRWARMVADHLTG